MALMVDRLGDLKRGGREDVSLLLRTVQISWSTSYFNSVNCKIVVRLSTFDSMIPTGFIRLFLMGGVV